MENPELETKKENTVTVEMTVMEAAMLGMNLYLLTMQASMSLLPGVADPKVLKSFLLKLKEGLDAATGKSGHDQGGPSAGSGGSASSGEPAGADQVPVPEA